MSKFFFTSVGLLLFWNFPAMGDAKEINLPKMDMPIGINLTQALETRMGSRHFNGNNISFEQIAPILWAGYGEVAGKNGKSIHGYDVISGATSKNRLTVPSAWGRHYLQLFLLISNGAYRYVPKDHKLILISTKNLINDCGANASNPSGVIMIAVDYLAMPEKNTDVAFMTAGAAAQNMSLAGTAFGIQTLLQTSFKRSAVINGLELEENVVPLAILSFGRPEAAHKK